MKKRGRSRFAKLSAVVRNRLCRSGQFLNFWTLSVVSNGYFVMIRLHNDSKILLRSTLRGAKTQFA